MFEQFIDESKGIVFPSISNMTPARKCLKYNLDLETPKAYY
jgi:hypothetical protein